MDEKAGGGGSGGPAEPQRWASGLGAAAARWWDRLYFEAAFGRPPSEAAGEGEVCCRACGRPVGALMPHLGPAHGMDKDGYTDRWPAAPLSPPEGGG